MERAMVVFTALCALCLATVSALAQEARPDVLGGAYDEMLPILVRGRTFVPSFKARAEYDDNILTTETDTVSSWVYAAEPKFDVHLLGEMTYFGLSYQFSYLYFENRDDHEDMSHDVVASLNHMFSPRVEVRIRDIFRRAQEPQDIASIVEEQTGTTREVVRRRLGDYDTNRVNTSLSVQVSEKFTFIGAYDNLLVDYVDPEVSRSFDRTEDSASPQLQYILSPTTYLTFGYRRTWIRYEDEEITPDSITDLGFAGVTHRFSPNLSGSFNGGYQERTYDPIEPGGPEISDTAPYVDVSLSSPIGKTTRVQAGYQHTIQETEQSLFLAQITQTVYALIERRFGPHFDVRLNGAFEHGTFDIDMAQVDDPTLVPESATEDTLQASIVLRYQLRSNWFAETGWRYTDVESDFPNATYERNRTFIGVSAIF